ncbi:reverse transcriptase domain-containing protein [Tanacetum coccineum]
MSTQYSSNQISLHFSNPEKSLQFRSIEVSESENLFLDHIHGEYENAEDVQMADHLRPMEELLRIPILGIEDVIVVSAVLADQFELKPELLDFISNNPFFGLENDDPHSHIKRFYQINQVPDDVVKLILFPFSLKGAAETRLENEPPNSITSWDDLVSKFLNRFFPHSKTRELRKEITNFQQVFGETFTEAWERFKNLLRKCPHHGFSLLYQIDFFYNGLSQSDQDSLNTAARRNMMMRNIQEVLTTIKNKARVRTCRNKPQNLSSSGTSTQIDAITALTIQVEALEYHFASMQETYDQNQEAVFQLIQNQMGQLAEDLRERPLGVLPSNTVTDPLTELNVITSIDGLTLDGSFIPHYDFLVYQEKEQEPETIKEVNPTGRADHFVYRIDIVDYLCDKFPIENNSLSGNPTPSSDSVVESLSASPIPCGDRDHLLEETDTLLSHFDYSPPKYETFSFDIEEKSSGSTTTHSDYSLPDYEVFYFDDDHIEEKSSGSTTIHSDFSLPEYDSFIFDLSIDPLPPADRSDFYHEEFADELAHIISSPEYDYFYFDLEDISSLDPRESTPEFSEIDLLVSFPSGNEDIIFDPGIFIIKGVQSERFHILSLDDFYPISFVSAPLFLTDPPEIETFLSFLAENEDKVFDPGIFFINRVFSFQEKLYIF